MARAWITDGIAGGTVAAVVSGAPSTMHSLVAGRDPLESTLAAGSLVLPRESRRTRLLAAALPVHLALSLGWALPLAALLPRRRTVLAGAIAGAALYVVDFGLVGRRFRRLRELPLLPQLADHAAYGAVVSVVVARRRAARARDVSQDARG